MRERKPGEGVEQIVQVVRPGFDSPRTEDAQLVITVLVVRDVGRDKVQGLAAFYLDARFFREYIQPIEIGMQRRTELIQPGAQRIEDRMR